MEQKKRKHPNLFDIIFIVLILAVAGGAYYVSHSSAASGKKVVTRSYTLELDNLEDSMADCVKVGDAVTDNVKNYDMGTVTSIETVPYTVSVTDEETGTVKQVPVKGYVSLWLTVEADTVETESKISTVSGYELRTGTSVACSVGSLVATGYVLSIDR